MIGAIFKTYVEINMLKFAGKETDVFLDKQKSNTSNIY